MAFALSISGIFILLVFLSTLISRKAYRSGVKVRKVLLVQLSSFVFSIFTCSAVALAAAVQDEKTNSVSAQTQVVQTDKNGGAKKNSSVESVAETSSQSNSNPDINKGLGFIAMAICMGFACLAAGIAVASAASAAIGAVSEDKKSFGTSLVFVALAEGVTVFGLLISIFIYNGLRE